jgi:hypothetical protein
MKKAGAEVEKLYKKARKVADSSDDTESSDPAGYLLMLTRKSI